MNIPDHHLYVIFTHEFIFLQGIANVEETARIDFFIQMSHAKAYTTTIVTNSGIVNDN